MNSESPIYNYQITDNLHFQQHNTKRLTGFTLIELILVIVLFSTLVVVSGYLFTVTLRAWDSGQIRAGIRQDMNSAMEKIVRDLKNMEEDSLSTYSGIDHTIQFNDLDSTTYVLYLYNAADASLDSTYSEDYYDLYKANISLGDDPDSGEGVLMLRNLVSPDAAGQATALTINGGVTQVTVDLVIERQQETLRGKTKVSPRNL